MSRRCNAPIIWALLYHYFSWKPALKVPICVSKSWHLKIRRNILPPVIFFPLPNFIRGGHRERKCPIEKRTFFQEKTHPVFRTLFFVAKKATCSGPFFWLYFDTRLPLKMPIFGPEKWTSATPKTSNWRNVLRGISFFCYCRFGAVKSAVLKWVLCQNAP